VRAGDVVWNPLSGEKALIVESGDETGGARLVAHLAVEAGGFNPGGEHVHDHCTEHLEVRRGRITFTLDGHERTLGAGERITVAPGTWHHWRNAEQDELLMCVRVEPALGFAEGILIVWGLCADGRTDAQGRPSPLLGVLVATRLRREIRFRRPPDLVQRLLFPPLAALARRRGLERTLERYLDLGTHPSAQAGLGRLPEHVMRPIEKPA
jgi:mannose-6-phosphate isomerase-like protein (cupin superfamily)